MISSKKPFVSKEQTFDILEIRAGRILSIESAADVPKPAYVMTADGQGKGSMNAPGRKLVFI